MAVLNAKTIMMTIFIIVIVVSAILMFRRHCRDDPEKYEKHKRKVWTFIGVVIVLGLIIIGATYYRSSNNTTDVISVAPKSDRVTPTPLPSTKISITKTNTKNTPLKPIPLPAKLRSMKK